MSISIQEVLIGVRRKLIATASVTAMVQDRVHTQHFYDFDSGTIPMPLVILELVGGEGNYGQGNQSVSLYVYTYSKESTSEAGALYDNVYSALQAEKITGDTLTGFVQETSRPISGYNPSARSYYYRGSFVALVAG